MKTDLTRTVLAALTEVRGSFGERVPAIAGR
jgi:hypothetical protein